MDIPGLLDACKNVLYPGVGTPQPDIEAFCQTKYGKSYILYRGVDPQNPPGPENYPIIVIKRLERSEQGENSRMIIYDIEFSVVIENTTIDNTTNPAIFDYKGLREVEEFREVVENVLIKDPSIPFMISASGATVSESLFPIFHSHSVLRLSVPQNYRGTRR